MIIIYDFDGTLTPYSMPQYEILKKCGYDSNTFQNRIEIVAKEKEISLYESYYDTFKEMLDENNLLMTAETISLGADKVKFNPGVLDYFKDLKNKNPEIKHYIVTSGFQDYIYNTVVAPFVEKVYGVTYKKKNEIYIEIEQLVNNKLKPQIIKEILKDSNEQNVIYIGDGMTDKDAFEYVHSIGGISIYVGSTDEDFNNYIELKQEEIVDKYFERDYSKGSELREYIMKKAGIKE